MSDVADWWGGGEDRWCGGRAGACERQRIGRPGGLPGRVGVGGAVEW